MFHAVSLSLQSHPPPLGAPQSSSAQGPLNPKSGPGFMIGYLKRVTSGLQRTIAQVVDVSVPLEKGKN